MLRVIHNKKPKLMLRNPQSPIFEATRQAALNRVQDFAPRAGRLYAGKRNTDEGHPNRQNVSMLSPYLRHRLITEQEVLTAVLAQHSLASAEKFVQEVFWRAYFKGYLETRPFIWQNYVADVATMNPSLKAYQQAIDGTTGIDCFDHWVGELKQTGYLHNHARMWFASIWIFTLHLPWAWGADFMFRYLVDGDPASNTLSWRWVGGLHTKGKTYLARPDNIAKYTEGRFSPSGLATVALPLDEPPTPPAQPVPTAASIAPQGKFGLLIMDEDLNPESLLAGHAPAAIAITPSSKAFTQQAQEDCVARCEHHWGQVPKRLLDFNAAALATWCEANDLHTLVTAYAPVGETATTLASLAPALEKQGIALMQLRRPYDSLCWPHATKGFFAMKEKIPAILAKLNIGQTQQDMFDA
jgi:deoxyribodipyrimidine photo-lyase